MSKTYEFLVECGVFFVATINENSPAIRPFGAVMEHDNALYISTANYKDVYSQMVRNPRIQISAKREGTRDWIRINGAAAEVFDLHIKQKMLDTCPRLISRFGSNDCEQFALFRIDEMESSLNINSFVKLN